MQYCLLKPKLLFASGKEFVSVCLYKRNIGETLYILWISLTIIVGFQPYPKHGTDLSAQMTSLSPTCCKKFDSIAAWKASLTFSWVLSLSLHSITRSHTLLALWLLPAVVCSSLSCVFSPPRDSKAAHSSAEAASPPDLLSAVERFA